MIEILLHHLLDCFVRNKLWFPTFDIKNAACDIDAPEWSSEYECQEDCRKCKDCRFFQYFKDTNQANNECDFFETSKEEVRGKPLEKTSSGYRDHEGTVYNFAVSGPDVCGKPIFHNL